MARPESPVHSIATRTEPTLVMLENSARHARGEHREGAHHLHGVQMDDIRLKLSQRPIKRS
jgi:hypothetical protein